MKKNISVKLFFTVIGRGIWQAICWVGSLFGFKDGSRYSTTMKRIMLGCITLILLCFTIAVCLSCLEEIDYKTHHSYSAYRKEMNYRPLGDDYTYAYNSYGEKLSYITDNRTGEKVLKDIIWLYEPRDGDSLALYKTKDDKRGYFNRYTGKVQIEPRFDRAWIFSGGLASVMENGEVFFIDHNGNKAIDITLPYPRKLDGYCFHGDYCAVENKEHKVGMIDRNGNWVLEPEYVHIESYKNQYWLVEDPKHTGVMTDSLTFVLPIEYTCVVISDEGEQEGIFATKDGVRKFFDLQGNLINDFVVDNVGKLYYTTEKNDGSGETYDTESDCMWYTTEYGKYGLMDKSGKPITKAVYADVDAITANTFKCQIIGGEAIIMDKNGKQIQ